MNESAEIPQNLEKQEKQKERLQKELNLGESITWFKEETRKKIEDITIQTIFDLIPATNTPIENLSIRIGGDYYEDYDVSFSPNHDMNGGKISYERGFLWDIGEKMEKKSAKQAAEAETELISKTAHEMYHLQEAKRFPKRYERTVTHSLDWGGDRADLAGQIFALQYLKTKPQTPPIRKEVGKLTKDIRKLKRYRLKKGY